MKNKKLIYGALVVGFLAYLLKKKDSSTTVSEDKGTTSDVGNDKNETPDGGESQTPKDEPLDVDTGGSATTGGSTGMEVKPRTSALGAYL